MDSFIEILLFMIDVETPAASLADIDVFLEERQPGNRL